MEAKTTATRRRSGAVVAMAEQLPAAPLHMAQHLMAADPPGRLDSDRTVCRASFDRPCYQKASV
jgi:hypothetical protein